MKHVARAGLASVTALAALAFAGSALAAVSPKLTVTASPGAHQVTISAKDPNPADDALARLQIYVPTGFALNAPAGGAVVGKATGLALVKDIDPSAEQPFMDAKIVAIGPTDPAVSYESSTCDTGTHAAAWMLQVNTNESQVSFPIFVDQTTGSETQFGAYKLVLCTRPPDVAPTTADRSPMGTKLDAITLTLSGFKVPTAPGDYRWRSLWTPFQTGTANLNTAGNVEAQSIVRIARGTLTIAAKVAGGHGKLALVRVSGRLALGGEPASKITVALSRGPAGRLRTVNHTRTAANGSYLMVATLKRGVSFLQTGVTIPAQDLGSGGCTASFGAPCADATVGAATVVSRALRVKA